MSTWVLYLLLLRATVMSFSGFASVPLVREDLVTSRGVLTDHQLNAAIAISQASPGALGLYVVVVGFFVLGFPGAAVGAVALATPAMLAIPIWQIVRRGSASALRGASRAIVIASAVLMLTTAARLGHEALPTWPLGLLAIFGFAALATGRVPPVAIVVLSALAGVLVRLF